jgi:tRNA U55 pseudouridine synthase TruB
MTSLVRTASGPFQLSQAARLEDLEKAGPLAPGSLKGADESLAHLPARDLDAEDELKVERGQPVAFPEGKGPGGQNRWRLRRADGSLAALGVARSRGIQPDKVFKREPA